MKKNNFNSNYKYNSEFESEYVKKRVEEIMNEEINPQTLDFLFRYNSKSYSSQTHDLLELPGEFDDVKDSAVLMLNQTAKQMDYLETVFLDGGMVLRDSANNVEHQTGRLNSSKAYDIFEYWLSNIINLQRLCYAVVVTDYDYEDEFKDYVFEGVPFRIYFRTFNREKIYKILNKLKEKDYTKFRLSDYDYLNMVYCMIFSKKDFCKDIITQLTYLFATMENLKNNHLWDLYTGLKMMIKFRFQDDLKTKKELLTMLTKSVSKEKQRELISYEGNLKRIAELEEQNARVMRELDSVKSDNSRMANRIEKLEKICLSHNIVV